MATSIVREPSAGQVAPAASGPFIAMRDGTQIYYKDWGSGQPTVTTGARCTALATAGGATWPRRGMR